MVFLKLSGHGRVDVKPTDLHHMCYREEKGDFFVEIFSNISHVKLNFFCQNWLNIKMTKMYHIAPTV